eukprot:Tbor_TRINITY_DN1146_c0_g1::TRINITY_DN1146_c0_g1_i1::g.15608::m.15608/K00948/PRPS, prsA; ribose-phosphate pyrophosphokinase
MSFLSSERKRGDLKIVTGNSNPSLAEAVCKELDIKLCNARVSKFANGETDIKILDNVRGSDLFVFQPTCTTETCNVNQSLMEALLMIHTAKLSSVRRVTAVIPHYGYGRQDRKHSSRVPISASAVARMLIEMGIAGVITLDLHCGQIQGFFHACPVSDLNASMEYAEYARGKNFNLAKTVIVAPDAGAVTRARRLADKIGATRIVTILKRRVEANKIDSMQLVGEVKDCVAIIADDMIDTGGTLVKAAEMLKEYGATEVHAWATHGILTDPACERINACDAIKEVVVTDSIPQEKNLAMCPKLKIISIAKLLAEAIHRIHNEESMEHVGEKDIPLFCGNTDGMKSGISSNTLDRFGVTDDLDNDDWKQFPK